MIQIFDQEILLTISNLRISDKNNDKEKYVYKVYRITFDSAGSWSFDEDRDDKDYKALMEML